MRRRSRLDKKGSQSALMQHSRKRMVGEMGRRAKKRVAHCRRSGDGERNKKNISRKERDLPQTNTTLPYPRTSGGAPYGPSTNACACNVGSPPPNFPISFRTAATDDAPSSLLADSAGEVEFAESAESVAAESAGEVEVAGEVVDAANTASRNLRVNPVRTRTMNTSSLLSCPSSPKSAAVGGGGFEIVNGCASVSVSIRIPLVVVVNLALLALLAPLLACASEVEGPVIEE